MFLKLSLGELYDNKKCNLELFSNRQKRDLKLMINQMENEDVRISLWTIYEITNLKEEEDTFVYCLNDYSINEVFIHVSKNGEIELHYFKFVNEKNYKAIKAKSIQEAIEQNRINWNKYEDFQIQKLYNPVAQEIVTNILKNETSEQIKEFIHQLKINNLAEYIFHFTEYEPDHENDDFETLISETSETLKYSKLERTVLRMLIDYDEIVVLNDTTEEAIENHKK